MAVKSPGEARTFADFLALPDDAKLAMIAHIEGVDGSAAAQNLAVSLGLRAGARATDEAQPVAPPNVTPVAEPTARPSRKAISLERRAERLEAEVSELPSAEQDAAREAMRRVLERRRPHQPMEQDDSGESRVATEFGSGAAHVFRNRDAFGTASGDFARTMMTQLGVIATGVDDNGAFDAVETNAMVAAVEAVRPENEIEAMLAVQMVATHRAAMQMMARVVSAKDQAAVQDYGALATKLLRIFPAQVEALAKLRRKGEQIVRVEHVHVYQGGQAIVGNVTAAGGKALPGGGVQHENGHQPHALTGPAALALQADPSMLRPDAGRDAVPVASGGREDAVPDARRGGRKRRPKG